MDIIAGCHPWTLDAYIELARGYPARFVYAETPEELVDMLNALRDQTEHVFFLHWSWKVPMEITSQNECVAFHCTNLPYGRGGTPLQNLILRGTSETMVSAFRMTDELDAGPIYDKAGPVPLTGNAAAIYPRLMRWYVSMIKRWVRDGFPEPVPQDGVPVIFERRPPGASLIHQHPVKTLQQLYDHIRMTDADGYPRAYLRHAGFQFEFRDPVDADDAIVAQVVITKLGT